MSTHKIIIGRIDIADFPAIKLFDIPVKIDTGAFTSSIHCSNIHIEDNKLVCNFLDPDQPEYHNKQFVFERFQLKKVKSSNGIIEERYAIETNIKLFNKTYLITLTLTDRGTMKFPVLLGRSFLSKEFIVDTSRTNLSNKKKLKESKK